MLTIQEQFFFDNAGYSYDPKTETEEEGRIRGAKELAKAETNAARFGVRFHWEFDCIDSSEFSDEQPPDEQPPYKLWYCTMLDSVGTVSGVGGIDLGRHGHPSTGLYSRVVEADLACEYDFSEVIREETLAQAQALESALKKTKG